MLGHHGPVSTSERKSKAVVPWIDGGGSKGEPCSALSGRRIGVDEKIAIAFWLAFFGVVASFVGALAGIALHLDTTMLEAGFIGAFLGGLPILFLPTIVRWTWGRDTRFAIRHGAAFRVATAVWAALVVGSRISGLWPLEPHGSLTISTAGLVAAIFASWYLPHFPRALRIWVRQQHPFSESRS
jgi:hypothetical protein